MSCKEHEFKFQLDSVRNRTRHRLRHHPFQRVSDITVIRSKQIGFEAEDVTCIYSIATSGRIVPMMLQMIDVPAISSQVFDWFRAWVSIGWKAALQYLEPHLLANFDGKTLEWTESRWCRRPRSRVGRESAGQRSVGIVMHGTVGI